MMCVKLVIFSSVDLLFSNISAEVRIGLYGSILLTAASGTLMIKQINLIRPQSPCNSLNGAELTARTWIRSGKQRDREECQDLEAAVFKGCMNLTEDTCMLQIKFTFLPPCGIGTRSYRELSCHNDSQPQEL